MIIKQIKVRLTEGDLSVLEDALEFLYIHNRMSDNPEISETIDNLQAIVSDFVDEMEEA